jgi:hypothetical protein
LLLHFVQPVAAMLEAVARERIGTAKKRSSHAPSPTMLDTDFEVLDNLPSRTCHHRVGLLRGRNQHR